MKNVILCLSLILLCGLAPLHAQCKVAATGISSVTGGYTVTLPPQVVTAVPTQNPLRLVLRDAAGNVSSVAGPVRVLSTGQLWIQTSERLASSPQSCPSEVVLQGASLDPFECLDAEFGPSCFLKWCAGVSYCLPGPVETSCKCL
jgi:hypothetical protein